MKSSRSLIAKAAFAAVVLAAAGTASVAQAHGSVAFSIGANIGPGVAMSATNAPYYYGPAVAAPAPVYMAPAYVAAPVYMAPAPVMVEPAPMYGAPIVGVQYIWSPVHHRYYYYDHGRRHWR